MNMFRNNFLKQLSYNSARFITKLTRREPPPSYGNPNLPDKLYKTIELEMKSAEPAVIRSYTKFLTMAANNLNIEIGKSWKIKPTKQRWALLKSVHVHRKHIVHYEVRTHYYWIQFHKLTGSTADTFLEYVERMLPEGVALKVTRVGIEPLPDHFLDIITEKEKDLLEEGSEKPQQEVKEEITTNA